jgi:hypothetical protein
LDALNSIQFVFLISNKNDKNVYFKTNADFLNDSDIDWKCHE